MRCSAIDQSNLRVRPTSVSSIADAIVDLATTFSGELLTPRDAGYEEARRVHNGLVNKRPALIARCRGVADVADAIRTRTQAGPRSGSSGRRSQRCRASDHRWRVNDRFGADEGHSRRSQKPYRTSGGRRSGCLVVRRNARRRRSRRLLSIFTMIPSNQVGCGMLLAVDEHQRIGRSRSSRPILVAIKDSDTSPFMLNLSLRVFHFEQTHLDNARQISRLNRVVR